MSKADEFLMGGGVPSAKFPDIGTTVTGVITHIAEPQQQRDFASGAPKTWDDGSPMMQLPVHLLTEQRDPDIADDEGLRAIYIKGGLVKAVRDAVRQAGGKGLEVGGTLTVTYARDGVAKQRGFNPPKEYDVTYASPGAAASGDFLGVNGQQTATAQPAPAAPPASDPVTTARSLLAVGTPAEQVAQLTGLDMAVIAALSNLPAPIAS
jgi:hypothetical protein